MNYRFLISLVLLSLFCTKQPQIDPNLYGTWLVIGFNNKAEGIVTSEKGYTVAQSLKIYRIESNSLTQFTRGVDYSLPPIYGSIEFYDSIRTDAYMVDVGENSISSKTIGQLSYYLLSQCNAQFLKLSKSTTGYDPSYGTVSVEINEYCIKVSKDSIPLSWPHDDDVIKPDSLCNPGSLIDW